MKRPPRPASRPRGLAALTVWAAAMGVGCAGAAGGSGASPPLSEAGWRSLAAARPVPLPGAVRLSVGEVEVLGELPWPRSAPVTVQLGLTELVAAGMLRRPDVRIVERRRFGAAVEAERSGGTHPVGAPRAGVSPGAELSATLTWVPFGRGEASLELRLIDSATGRVTGTWRSLVPADAEPVGLARAAIGSILAALGEMGRLAPWDDPVAGAAPDGYVASGVPSAALADFLAGLAAEERWRWEDARLGYESAARAGGFFEAEAALARTARLRLGGTLGES